ncbi:hypothetical protein GOV13_01790 [Candidatus Pacearchaeota archaeon]|nr:hypothetical protein [Candidatus Pacearchaeota archaeon]
MAKKTKKEQSKKKEEICEVFEVEGKDGKEKIIRTCGKPMESKPTTKKQIDHHNRLLGNILLVLGVIIILFIGGYFAVDSIRHFEYEGVKFDVVKEGELVFYRTTIPAMYQGRKVDYNFFLRKDPRKLEDVPFEGEFDLPKNLVINLTEEFNCDGDGMIAIANLVKLYEFIRVPVLRDENASCSENKEYMFVRIQQGNSTEIKEIGPACYEINVANCEILEGTERFMVETFIDIQGKI